VVHHIGVYLRPRGSAWLSEAQPGRPLASRDRVSTRSPADELLDLYVPGGVPQSLPSGQARLIPAGSDLIFQLHYTPNGKPARDRSRIGLVFAKGPVRHRVHTLGVAETKFVIPPGAPAHPVTGTFYLPQDATVLAITPHMHLRGKSMECRAIYANGRRLPLLRVPRYSFNWQMTYHLAEPLAMPAGSWLQCSAIFDNSPNNRVNPDPAREVRWGDQSWEEMMVGYIDVAIDAGSSPRVLYESPAKGR